MYFTQKILRFVGRLILKLLLWPVRMGWRLLRQQRSNDSTDTDWTERDEDSSDESANSAAGTQSPPAQSSETTGDEAGGGATEVEEPPSTATAATAAGPAIESGAVGRFRRVLLGAGVVSGLSAIVSPLMFGLPIRYFGEAGLLGRLLVDGTIPVVVAGVLAWGVSRRQTWAWYGGVGWGALVILTYPLRTAVPAVLLAPFDGAWMVLGNLGALADLYDPLAALSAIGVGGAVLFTGYRAHPDGWAAAPAGADDRDEPGAVDAADEDGVADPAGGSATDGTSTPTETGATAETAPDDASPTPTAEADTTAAVSEPDAGTDESDAESATEAATESDETATGSESDAAESEAASRSDADPIGEYREELTAEDPATRQEAVRSLAETTAEGAVPEQAVIDALADRLENDDSAEVRVAACQALGQLGTDADRARTLLEDYRLDADGDVSRAASRALRDTDA